MVLPASERPDHLRTILLAYPTRVTKKYVPPVYTGKVFTGVRRSAVRGKPKENWRLSKLAIPNRMVPKYVFVEETGTGVSPSALTIQASPRTIDMSKPTLRYLLQARKAYIHLGPRILKNLNKTIDQSWNTIYNYYRKQLLEIKRKKDARLAKQTQLTAPKAKSPKEIQEEKEKRFAEWSAVKALPKKPPPPAPLPERRIADLKAIFGRICELAEPGVTRITPKYRRPSRDPTYVDPLRVTPAARAYVASERVLELAKNPPHRLVKEKPIIPGAVKRGALTGPVPPRFEELAQPKKKAAEKDSDLKENPFQISPNALKAKPSARTKELAKPIER